MVQYFFEYFHIISINMGIESDWTVNMVFNLQKEIQRFSTGSHVKGLCFPKWLAKGKNRFLLRRQPMTIIDEGEDFCRMSIRVVLVTLRMIA